VLFDVTGFFSTARTDPDGLWKRPRRRWTPITNGAAGEIVSRARRAHQSHRGVRVGHAVGRRDGTHQFHIPDRPRKTY